MYVSEHMNSERCNVRLLALSCKTDLDKYFYFTFDKFRTGEPKLNSASLIVAQQLIFILGSL